jgi:hypothetical protein
MTEINMLKIESQDLSVGALFKDFYSVAYSGRSRSVFRGESDHRSGAKPINDRA